MNIRKTVWTVLGIIFLGIAYIGTVVPGIPWSTPCILAAWCFSKSSDRFHNYMLNHKLFGPFIRNWRDNRVYPTKVKWIMFICMDISLIIIWVTTQNLVLFISVALFMAFWMIWAIRYPGTIEEWQRRKAAGEKIGWFK